MSDKKLSGKVALVTGGARGLGRGYALRLASLGADVAIIDRNLRGAEVYEFERAQLTADTVMAECEALGVRAMGLEVDLTDRAATEAAINQVAQQMGRLDILVANAGGGTVVFADEKQNGEKQGGGNNVLDDVTTGPPSNTSEEMLNRVMDINIRTCMYTCMAATPHLKAAGGGKIVTLPAPTNTTNTNGKAITCKAKKRFNVAPEMT